MKIIPQQRELRRELPVVVGNVDYRQFEAQLERIDDLLIRSGLEAQYVERRLAAAEAQGRAEAARQGQAYRPWSAAAQRKYQGMCRQALRCTIARQLTEKPMRAFSRRLAESEVLRWFCQIDRIDVVHVPSKSALDRYEKLAPEGEVRELVYELNRQAAAETEQHPLQLAEGVGLELAWIDNTCLKANIHFPVDWVLLRDGVRTLIKAVAVIRRHGLKQRMEEPAEFLRAMNRHCIGMTQARGKKEGPKRRKKILRQMKKLSRRVGEHAQRYQALLQERWAETDLKAGEVEQIVARIAGVLQQLPAAIRQAHERIIGERPVPNAEKILSLYDEDLHVIKRGKAGVEVEFGNTLLVSEQQQGLIVDWRLEKEQAPAEGEMLEQSLERYRQAYGQDPVGVGTDRGFDRAQTRAKLEGREIFNGMCPRSVAQLRQCMKDEAFVLMQRRRSQTEGRIGILLNDFLGPRLRNKGFESREVAVAWAVLAHNLWVLARLPQAETQVRKKAA